VTSREYPSRPIPAVAAVIIRNGQVLLSLRGNEPNKGKWGIPGGVVEVGEKIEEALIREVKEETGVDVKPLKRVAIFDSIRRDAEGKVQYHYILFEYLCEYVSGELRRGDDALDVKWVKISELHTLDIMELTRRFIEKIVVEESLSR